MNYIDDFSNEISKQMIINIDNAIFKFLNNNGYSINSIADITRLKEIVQELKERDLFVDIIQFTLPYDLQNKTELKVSTIIYPFFNHISNPIDKVEFAKMVKEKYAKGELDNV